MDIVAPYWLVSIDETSATVALVSSTINIGPVSTWDPSTPETLIEAINSSIASVSAAVSLSETEEPNSAGFVIPPFWVDSDGKITSPKLSLIEGVCKKLDLKPLGFVPEDEAIVECFATKESSPQSFVLMYFDQSSFIVSLVIVGKITQRLCQPFSRPFDPQIIQECFHLFPEDSVFPPQIYLFGQVDTDIFQSIAGFRWPSSGNRDFFLHLPEITCLTPIESFLAFSSVITPPEINPTLPPPPPLQPETFLSEVAPEDLGFTNQSLPELVPLPVIPITETPLIAKPVVSKVFFPKIPKLTPKIWFIPLFLIIISLLFYFLPGAAITIFLSPFTFDKKIPVTLDSKITTPDFKASLLTTTLTNIDIATSATIPATGAKIIGDKAKGEIVVYNKTSKVQNLPRSLVLLDTGGKKYELASPIQVPPSTAKLDQGIIEMGQTKVSIIANDIGPEFNLNPNINLTFKDYQETEIIARTTTEISGGNRSEVKVVSAADKIKINQSIKDLVNVAVLEKTKVSSSVPDLLPGSWQVKSEKISLNREVGEVSDTLSATASTSLVGYLLPATSRADFIKYLISQEPELSQSTYQASDFSFEFIPDKFNESSVKGSLAIKGFLTPKADPQKIAQLIAGRAPALAFNLLRQSLPRLYDWRFSSSLIFPLNPNRISVEIKSQ